MDQLLVIWTSAQCGFEDWQDLWGDPWLSGSALVLSYAIAGILLIKGAKSLTGRERALWMLCGVVFLFQTFNTPLDLHGFVWTFGRCLAKAQGWYAVRGHVQQLVFIGLVSAAILAIAVCIFTFRRNIWRNRLLLTGVLIAVGSTGIKGLGLQGIAQIYRQRLGPFYITDWIELFGIAMVLVAVIHRSRKGAQPDEDGLLDDPKLKERS